MYKKLASGSIGLLLLASPLLVSGQTTVSVQAQIDALLKQITQLQAQITALRGQSTTPTASTSRCLDLKNALIDGSTDATTNGEVSKLQRFLGAYRLSVMDPGEHSGIPPEELQPVTGYYGTKTAASVMQWQKAHGMDFVTTRSGVGPMTRAKMKCTDSVGPAIQKINWRIESANPTITDENDYRKYEQAIFVDVIRSDNSIRGYSVGKAYGCWDSHVESTQDGRKVLGRVDCSMAETGSVFLAYSQNGRFLIERQNESGRDGLTKPTVVLEI